MHPGKQALDLPVTAVAAQSAPVLLAALAPVWHNQLDSYCLAKPLVDPIRVVGFVTDEPRW